MKGKAVPDRVRFRPSQAVPPGAGAEDPAPGPFTTRIAVGTDAVDGAMRLCSEAAREFPRATFFSGKVVFQREKWYHWLLHNQTAYAVQRRLEWLGLPMIALPVRVREA